MFWGDLSKIKESLNAAATTLSSSATEAAKSYMTYSTTTDTDKLTQ